MRMEKHPEKPAHQQAEKYVHGRIQKQVPGFVQDFNEEGHDGVLATVVFKIPPPPLPKGGPTETLFFADVAQPDVEQQHHMFVVQRIVDHLALPPAANQG